MLEKIAKTKHQLKIKWVICGNISHHRDRIYCICSNRLYWFLANFMFNFCVSIPNYILNWLTWGWCSLMWNDFWCFFIHMKVGCFWRIRWFYFWSLEHGFCLHSYSPVHWLQTDVQYSMWILSLKYFPIVWKYASQLRQYIQFSQNYSGLASHGMELQCHFFSRGHSFFFWLHHTKLPWLPAAFENLPLKNGKRKQE